MELLTTIFFDPIFNALIWLYGLTGDFGVAIIVLTLLVRLVVGPFSAKAFKAQRRMQALQPELKKLQEKHKDDRETLAKEMMAFYQKEGVNPAASCLPTLVQIPFLIVIFFAIKDVIENKAFDLYPFVSHPGEVDKMFFGVLDLSTVGFQPSNIILGVITAGVMFWQARMMMPKDGEIPGMSRQLMFLFPVLTLVFAVILPAALPLYWASSTAFTILQQYYIIRRHPLSAERAVAVEDWNEANPSDPVDGAAKRKTKGTQARGKRGKKGAQVTVRSRGKGSKGKGRK